MNLFGVIFQINRLLGISITLVGSGIDNDKFITLNLICADHLIPLFRKRFVSG